MNFKGVSNIKRVVLCLLGIMLVSYGIAAIVFFSFGNFSFAEMQNNYDKFGGHGIFRTSDHNYNYHDSKSASLDGINSISVDVYCGRLKFTNEGSNSIKVKVDGTVSTSSAYSKPELKCYKEGSTLYVKLIGKNRMIFFGNYSSNMDVSVSIPSNYKNDLKVVDSAGDMEISDYGFKNLDCNLSAGRLLMNNMSADTFTYKNSAGDLKADNLKTKRSNLRASAGRIQITRFTGDVEGSNSAGNTEIEYDKFDNNVDFSASAGRTKLTLPEDSQFKLDAEASAGSIRTDFFGINISGEFGEKTAKGEIGKSNNMIRLKSSAGGIEINN